MSALGEFYIKEEMLETLLKTVRAKKEKGISLTVSISDTSNQYGQNLSAYVSQSKEQREAKKERFFVGNGKVFWNDGKILNATKEPSVNDVNENTTVQGENDLPF